MTDDAATRLAIFEIAEWSERVSKDPDAPRNKLKREQEQFGKLVSLVQDAMIALDYKGTIRLSASFQLGTNGLFIQGYGDRTAENLITKPGDFEEMVQQLRAGLEEVKAKDPRYLPKTQEPPPQAKRKRTPRPPTSG